MGRKTTLSTSTVEPHRRLDFWRAALAASFSPCEVHDCEASNFEAELTHVQVGNIAVSRVEGVPQSFLRPTSLIRSGDCDDYVATIRLKEGVDESIGDRDGEQPRHSIRLYDISRPYDTRNADRLSGMSVHIPREVLERALGPATRAVGLTIGRDHPIVPVIRAFFSHLMEHGHLFDSATADRMALIGVDLIASGFAAQLAQAPRTSVGSAALVYRAKVLIEDRLWDAALDTATIAAEMNLSRRRLQEVFAEQDLTVGGHLWDRRLAKARDRLHDPAYASLSIATIGYGVGFVSAAHFSRSFRRRFGTSPSEYRAAGDAPRGRE